MSEVKIPVYNNLYKIHDDFGDAQSKERSVYVIEYCKYIPLEDDKLKETIYNSFKIKPSGIEVYNRKPNQEHPPEYYDNKLITHVLLYFSPPVETDTISENQLLDRFGCEYRCLSYKMEAIPHIKELMVYLTQKHFSTQGPLNFHLLIQKLGLADIYPTFTSHKEGKEEPNYNARVFLLCYDQIIDKKYLEEALKYGQILSDKVISHHEGWTIAIIKYAKTINWKKGQNKFIFGLNSNYIFTLNAKHHLMVMKAIHNIDSSNESRTFFLSAGESVQFCKSESEVAFTSDPKSLMANLKAFEIMKNSEDSPGATYYKTYKLWGWQRMIFNKYLTKYPDGRSIIWCWGNQPGIGKSTMCSALMIQNPTYFFTAANPSSEYHMKTIKANARKAGWNNFCMFINLSMRFSEYENLFSMLECLKDPVNTTMKYNSSSDPCGMGHVVLFSNFPPKPYKWNEALRKWDDLIDPGRLVVIQLDKLLGEQDPNPPPPSGAHPEMAELAAQFGLPEEGDEQALSLATTFGVNKPPIPPSENINKENKKPLGKTKGAVPLDKQADPSYIDSILRAHEISQKN